MLNIDRYTDTNKLNFVPELCSAIIKEMTEHGSLHLHTKESFSFKQNGLYELLDQLCEYWGWSADQVLLTTPNVAERHDRYTIKIINYIYDGLTQAHFPPPHTRMIDQLRNIKALPWDGSHYYGLFVGRANATRLRAIELHRKFQFRDRGLTSYLNDNEQYIDPKSLLTYLCESDARWSEVRSVRPYSDIGGLLPVPVRPPYHVLGWEQIYKQIPIEIVCETSESEDSSTTTEKMFRPVLYRRPFLLISGRGRLAEYRNPHQYFGEHLTLRTFNHVISDAYDLDEGLPRVDHVFDILYDLINTGKIHTLLEQCQEDIEHNYQTTMAYFKKAEQHITYGRGEIGTDLDAQRIKNEQR
jgi:hypothetical protein